MTEKTKAIIKAIIQILKHATGVLEKLLKTS